MVLRLHPTRRPATAAAAQAEEGGSWTGEVVAAAASLQATGLGKPTKLKGLPPTRRAAVVKKELERTRPGRVRWLHAALEYLA